MGAVEPTDPVEEGGQEGGGGGDNSQREDWEKEQKRKKEEVREERQRKAGTKYFEAKIPLKELSSRKNYKFVAKLTDADGCLDQTNNPVNGPIWTSVRALFEQVEDARTDKDRREYSQPSDPGQMLRDLIDEARTIDDVFAIYYDESSIRNTDYDAQYTFRDTQLRNCIDKVRELCPANWHWFVDAGGKLHLRGPQHTVTHVITVGREALSYKNDKTIKNVKNIVILKGRQDEDSSEPDGGGSIAVEVRDELSIAEYGARYLFLRDANIKDLDTARVVAQGRLEENNKVEEHGSVEVLDEKEILQVTGPMRGYNVEAFQPGDFVQVIPGDATSISSRYYWNRALYNQTSWESGDASFLDDGVPIKKVTYNGDTVTLELSERLPSATSDFQKLVRWQQMQEQRTSD